MSANGQSQESSFEQTHIRQESKTSFFQSVAIKTLDLKLISVNYLTKIHWFSWCAWYKYYDPCLQYVFNHLWWEDNFISGILLESSPETLQYHTHKIPKKGTKHYIFKCSAEVVIYINYFNFQFADFKVKNWVLLW